MMKGPSPLPVVVAILLVSLFAQGEVLKYDWTVDYSDQAPDCVNKLVISVNGGYPGPTINATVGDTVVVTVHNKLPTEGVVIHWHGMLQTGSPWADGTAFVSQCPIDPEETFIYQFVVEQVGTYFYHGHHGMQRAAGFYGSLIVHPKLGEKVPFTYDGELSIIVNDWWHRSMYDQQLGLSSVPFRWIGEPQSLLIEGRGAYNCSLVPTGGVVGSGDCVTCNASSPLCAPYVLPVLPGLTYRLRIASVASLSSLNFIIEDHLLTVVEVDGHYVEPVVVDNLDIYSGESYSVLFTAKNDSSRNYWAGINVRGRRPSTPTGLAILNYLPNDPALRPSTAPPVSPPWDFYNVSLAQATSFKGMKGFVDSPPNVTNRRLFLLNTQNKYDGKTKWALNNVTYVPTSTPVLAALKFKLTSELGPSPPDWYTPGYDIYSPPVNPNTITGSGVYTFQLNDVVDVILQNANTMTMNNSEIHPWHLHGHDFWVLGYGEGQFDPARDYPTLNYYNPPLRNTVPVFPYGWVLLRFVANNSGVWPFHCHIEPHFFMGMGVVFAEGIDHLPYIPPQTLGCGLTKTLPRNITA